LQILAILGFLRPEIPKYGLIWVCYALSNLTPYWCNGLPMWGEKPKYILNSGKQQVEMANDVPNN